MIWGGCGHGLGVLWDSVALQEGMWVGFGGAGGLDVRLGGIGGRVWGCPGPRWCPWKGTWVGFGYAEGLSVPLVGTLG